MITGLLYKKTRQGTALVRTGGIFSKQPIISFSGIMYFPMVHNVEMMDVSLKRVEIERTGKNGLICKDNMRADIKVAFFVQVNKTEVDVLRVAQSVGCARASDPDMLSQLFDAKFSEALKTVGKHFEFVELYNSREQFKEEILKIIGRDLNGYVLDDAAIDYLEQTPVDVLDPENILDAEGIKKITDLTAKQTMLANGITREKEKVLTKQNVEAQEAILELNRQLAEKEEIQKREIANIRSRETATINKVASEERLKAETARIAVEEELQVAQQNMERQVLVAARNKEGTDAVETERVVRARDLEINERERIVTLAQIEKEKAVEEEKKNIQEFIRQRVIVEKAVVQEEEAIKDTKAKAQAEREKLVALTKASELAEQRLIEITKAAESSKLAAALHAEQVLIEAQAQQEASAKQAQAKKILADARATEEAVSGLAEANVMEAKARAVFKEGEAQAGVIERMAAANLEQGLAAAEVLKKQGEAEAAALGAKYKAEADGMGAKYKAEAEGVELKAEAMLKLDGVGREHEEFKLHLEKEKAIELAEINIRTDIARSQAEVLGKALEKAHIDILGGEMEFFDRLSQAVTHGKYVDRMVRNSETLQKIENRLTGPDGLLKLRELAKEFGLGTDDIRNLSVAALIAKMMGLTDSAEIRSTLSTILGVAKTEGVANQPASKFLG